MRHAPTYKQRRSTLGVDSKKKSHSVSKKAKARSKTQNNPKKKHPRIKHALRRGRNLGPTGAFPDSIIVQVLYGSYLNTITKYRINNVSEDIISESFKSYVHDPLHDYVGGLIDTLAPSDSNALRNSLHESISTKHSSHDLKGGTTGYKLVLNTEGIEYAKPVNKMPSSWLKHPGTHKKKTSLYDPKAVEGWFGFILSNSRNKALFLVMKWINSEFKKLMKIPLKELKMLGSVSQTYKLHLFIHSPTVLKKRYK